MIRRPPSPPPFPSPPLSRPRARAGPPSTARRVEVPPDGGSAASSSNGSAPPVRPQIRPNARSNAATAGPSTRTMVSRQGRRRRTGSPAHSSPMHSPPTRSEEHTSELQSQSNLVCRLLLEKKKHHETLDRHTSALPE